MLADMLATMGPDIGLFHSASGIAFADVLIDGHRETWPIRSQRVRSWLRRRYYDATGAALTAAIIGTALDLLETRAQFDAPERAVHIRIADEAGRIYLDLADARWRAVEISPAGWRVIGSPPVRFRRPAGMLALPAPQPGGSIEALAALLNLPDRNDLVAGGMAVGNPAGGRPYPLLAISGEPIFLTLALATTSTARSWPSPWRMCFSRETSRSAKQFNALVLPISHDQVAMIMDVPIIRNRWKIGYSLNCPCIHEPLGHSTSVVAPQNVASAVAIIVTGALDMP